LATRFNNLVAKFYQNEEWDLSTFAKLTNPVRTGEIRFINVEK
jgi:hypothetical protein